MIRPALLLAALSGPALAQDGLTSDALLASFQTICAGLEATPEAALAEAETNPAIMALQSEDKTVLQVTRSLEFGEGIIASIYYSQNVYPGGTQSSCTLTVNAYPGDPTQPLLPDLTDKIAAAAPTLLDGPATANGGPVSAMGATAELRRWVTGEAFPPPASLQYLQGPNFISLSILRLTPVSGN